MKGRGAKGVRGKEAEVGGRGSGERRRREEKGRDGRERGAGGE